VSNTPQDIARTLGIEVSDRPDPRWKAPKKGDPMARPIDYLIPGSALHATTLEYLLRRLKYSEREMSKFYDRWRFNEQRLQAYINLNDYEKLLKQANDRGSSPRIVNMVVPYTWATTMTIVTYMLQTFCGQKPIFQVSSLNAGAVERSQKMEMLLQYNADHTRLIRHLFQFFQDAETYGVSVMQVNWTKEQARRTVWSSAPEMANMGQGGSWIAKKQTRTVYEGNTVRAIDPFMFFPDPRVPMAEVNQRGEFCFWRTFEGVHLLRRYEQANDIKFVDAAGTMPRDNTASSGISFSGNSARSIRTMGEASPGLIRGGQQGLDSQFCQVDQGTIDIIPSELGLSKSEQVERWIFTILNKNQIVQAEPFDYDHGRHPVVVSEPYTVGYAFGQLGSGDLIGPFQDAISWFINSHIENVRTVLNNSLVVDPSKVEMQDIKNPAPGKLIRLKRSAYGQDVNQAVYQLQVGDVTRQHMQDVEIFVRMADMMTGLSDNLRGIQDSGGRKTATEVRTSTEAGANRLAASARLRSAQGLVDLAEMMCLNVQQLMSSEFEFTVLGMDGTTQSFRTTPEHLTGDFYFPVNDGTLPIDRNAQLDIWKEIFLAVSQDQQLRTEYSVPKIFDWVAQLSGARNIERFHMQPMPNQQVEQQAQAGNLVPTSALPQNLNGGASPPVVAQ
jgi:hypothetical protein